MAWHLITQGDDQNSNYMEFLLDNESDINNPPTSIYSYSLSSIAHTPGFTKVWECDANGNWIEVVNSGGGGGGASTAIVAPQYSDLTFPVSKGQHCIYNDGYYEANTNIATPESWTSAHWTQLTIGGEAQALKNDIQGKPETKINSELGVDLDITDESGNVIARLSNGHIATKNFDSSKAPEGKASSASNVDLDITDEDGNVIARFKDGEIVTKNFDSTDPFRVPSYYHTNNYIKGKCNRFNQLARSCAKKLDTFAFVTDLHWHLNAGNSPALLRYIKENTRIDKFFCGGDVCDFITSEHQPYDAWTEFYSALKMPTYVAMGNHEYLVAQHGKEGRLYYTFNSVGRDRIGNFDRNYFYMDNQQSQIRYIFLNGFAEGVSSWTYGYEQTQLDWLENVALDLEAGWGAIVVTHMTHHINFSDGTVPKESHALDMLSVLDNYSGDGEIICVVSGHTHADYLDYTTGGIPILVTTCDKFGPWIESGVNMEPWLSDRVEGTITEQVIDLFIIDREAKDIIKVRVGCPIHYGTDPETWTDYEEVTISYDRT